MKSIFIFLVLFLICPIIFAAELTKSETKILSDKAMDYFANNKLKNGYETFRDYWPMPDSEITALIYQTESQWGAIENRFGKNLGFEFIETNSVGESLMRHIYILKFENHAIRWIFTFYKPADKWFVNSLKFDDSVELLFN